MSVLSDLITTLELQLAAAPGPTLVVVAGPTAVGKGTVSAYIRDNYPQVWLSVSATTRDARPGEEEGEAREEEEEGKSGVLMACLPPPRRPCVAVGACARRRTGCRRW